VGRWAAPEQIAAGLRGERGGIDSLLAAIWPKCFRLAATIIGDRTLAQDAAQEACVIVNRKVRSLRSPEAFDVWLYRIVMREAIRIRRRTAHDARYSPDGGFAPDPTAPIDVWRSLDALAPEFRDVAVLFYFDDLPTAEIASILSIPNATVRTRLSRVRAQLRTMLGDYAPDAPSALDTPEVRQHAF
jgi:DNA-directed RNA polymerase specialized sigma24 family protein